MNSSLHRRTSFSMLMALAAFPLGVAVSGCGSGEPESRMTSFTGSEAKAVEVARKLRTGQVDINGGAFNTVAPFGGYKQSGFGRERGEYGFEEFLEVKAVQHS